MKKIFRIELVLILCLVFSLFIVSDYVHAKEKTSAKFSEDDLEITWIDGNYDMADSVTSGLILVRDARTQKYGFVGLDGKQKIECKYLYAGDCLNGLAPVKTDSKLYGFIDVNGNMVIEPQFYQAGNFSDGLSNVQFDENGRWGYIDNTGKLVIKTKYNAASEFSDGLAVVKKEGDKWGYINEKGKQVISTKYTRAFRFSNGYGKVRTAKGNVLFIDKKDNRKLVIKHVDYVSDFKSNRALVYDKKNKVMYYVNKAGKRLFDVKINFDKYNNYAATSFNNDKRCMIIYSQGDSKLFFKWLNESGKKVFATHDLVVLDGSEGLYASITTDNKMCFVDKNGKRIIPAIFDVDTKGRIDDGLGMHNLNEWDDLLGTYNFSEGYAVIKKDGKWGILKNPLK